MMPLLCIYYDSFYKYHNWNSMITPKKSISIFSKRNQRFFLFLYNFHVCEYDSIFIFIHNQSYHLRSTSYGALLILWLFKNPFMHYVRYQGKSILTSKGAPLLMNKWKYYLINNF